MTVSAAAKAVAQHFAAATSGQPRVDRYWDRDEKASIDIAAVADWPEPGILSLSTVDLHQAPNVLDGTDISVELMALAPEDSRVADALATAAFYVSKDSWLAAPGVVFPDILSMYSISQSLQHVMWVESPIVGLSPLVVDDTLTVRWLAAMPISESERTYLSDKGYFNLGRLLEERNVQLFDLDREAVV
jgi:antitoxin YqcF